MKSLKKVLLVRTEEELNELASDLAHLGANDLTIQLCAEDQNKYSEQIRKLYNDDHRHFIACGGDGSLNRLVNSLMKQGLGDDSSVAIIPMGTANDFAKGLGLTDNLEVALTQALIAPIVRVDVAQLNDLYFINVLSAGNPAKVTRDVSKELKAALGPLAYLINGVKEASELEIYQCNISAKGETLGLLNLTGFAIGNGFQAGGGFKVGNECEIDDGQLEVMLIGEVTTTQMAELFIEAKKDEPQFDYEYIKTFRTSEIEISSTKEIPLNLDGEGCELKEINIKVRPQSLGLSLPQFETEAAGV